MLMKESGCRGQVIIVGVVTRYPQRVKGCVWCDGCNKHKFGCMRTVLALWADGYNLEHRYELGRI